jgi:hypothetical protein
MKTASSAGSGRTCLLQPNRLWRKPAARKFQDDHSRQSALMQFYRWEKRWSYEKLEMKTKQIFVKTLKHFKKRSGVWAYLSVLEFTSHLEEISSLQISRSPLLPLPAEFINAV